MENLIFVINQSKEEIIDLLKNSSEFAHDTENSWAKTYYLQASNKIFILFLDDEIQICPHAGTGILDVIGTVKINQLTREKSQLTIEFQMGHLPMNLPKYVFIVLAVISTVLVIVDLYICLAISFFCLIALLVWISKAYYGRVILTKIKKTLNL